MLTPAVERGGIPHYNPAYLSLVRTQTAKRPMSKAVAQTAGVKPLKRWSGVVVMLGLVGLFHLLDHYKILFLHPVPILVLAVLGATLHGGIAPGLACALILASTAAVHMSKPDQLFHYTPNGLANLLVITAVGPAVATTVGLLRRRSIRAREALRDQMYLEAQLSERSRVGHELRQQKKEQQAIFDSVPAMIWFKDKENRILRVNALAAQSIGRTAAEIEGHSTAEFYPQHADKYLHDDLEVINSGKPKLGIIEPYVVAAGEKRWIRTDKIPYRDDDGNIVGVIVFAVDITEQQRAKEDSQAAHDALERHVAERTAELRSANENLRRAMAQRARVEERLQQIIDNTTAVIYVKDIHGRYTLINQRFVDLFHVDRESVVGKTDYDLFPKENADLFRANDRRVMESGNSIEFEEVAPHDDGPHHYISLKFPLLGESGELAGTCGISTDISPRIQTEALLRRSEQELRDYTIALQSANRELAAAREAAEEASRAKTKFLANISHEVRTPIMAMLGAAELLGASAPGGDGIDHRDMILRNGRHLLRLIDELLDISRIEAGKLEIRPADCSLSDVLQDVSAATEPLRRRKALEYRVIYETTVPAMIRTDRTRLTQALVNLVNNALKFTESGHVHVRIRLEPDAPDPRLTIAVEDTGAGIPAEQRERIFETFTQIEPFVQGASAGAGLGLPIARWIAERLGGSLEVESQVGVGSRFIMRTCTGPLSGKMPDNIEFQKTGALHSAASSLVIDNAERTLRGSVLLAEDATDTRDLIALALRRAGAEVATAADGLAAVELAGSTTFDLILLDIRMPELDGLAAARSIRRGGYRGPLIALTASTSDCERGRIMDAGFDDLWSKPISLSVLIERSAAYLDAAQDRLAGDPRLARERDRGRIRDAIGEFVGTLPVRLHAVRRAMESDDLATARELLHQLVGAGGIHGLPEVSRLAAKLSAALKNGGIPKDSADLHALEEHVRHLARDRESQPPVSVQ